MNTDLLFLLLAIVAGYLLPLYRNKKLVLFLNTHVGSVIYLIIFFMGITLAQHKFVVADIRFIACCTFVFALSIMLLNYLSLWLIDVLFPWQESERRVDNNSTSQKKMLISTLKLICILCVGCLAGELNLQFYSYASETNTSIIIALLFVVGILLRGGGITPRDVFYDRKGVMVSLVVIISSLAGGGIASLILGLSYQTGMAISSGYGWASLSGVMITKNFGSTLGVVAFLNDFIRLLVSIIFTPFLIRYSRSGGIGVCGVTSMDFTLPILQRYGGLIVIPVALSNGVILTAFSPVIMALFFKQ